MYSQDNLKKETTLESMNEIEKINYIIQVSRKKSAEIHHCP